MITKNFQTVDIHPPARYIRTSFHSITYVRAEVVMGAANGLVPEPISFTPVERRTTVRHSCAVPGSCRLIALRNPLYLDVDLRDIGPQGIGLMFPGWVQPGTFLAIRLASSPIETLRAKVVYATPEENSRWRVGCALNRELDQEELAVISTTSHCSLELPLD